MFREKRISLVVGDQGSIPRQRLLCSFSLFLFLFTTQIPSNAEIINEACYLHGLLGRRETEPRSNQIKDRALYRSLQSTVGCP